MRGMSVELSWIPTLTLKINMLVTGFAQLVIVVIKAFFHQLPNGLVGRLKKAIGDFMHTFQNFFNSKYRKNNKINLINLLYIRSNLKIAYYKIII